MSAKTATLQLKYKILFVTLPGVILIDFLTKALVVSRFQLGESVKIIEGFFNFTYVRNTGAAFGLLAKADPSFRIPFFLVVPVVALVVILLIFKKIPDQSRRMASALALVIGGAIGNLLDRVRYGYVVDFLDFHWNFRYHFPAFNVADMAICVGVGILMLDLFLQEE